MFGTATPGDYVPASGMIVWDEGDTSDKTIVIAIAADSVIVPPKQLARLTLVGRMLMPAQTFQRFADGIRHVPHVPRGKVVPYFLMADCFVFPSLFEGGGIVLYEACSAALGIIQSAMWASDVHTFWPLIT